jgi:hypothetical protein
MSGCRFFPCVLLLFIFVPLDRSFAQQGQHPVLDAPGFREHRDYFSEMPFEHIDTLTGSLVLRFTDLALPANAGRELRFERSYNSKTRGWNFGVAGVPLFISNPSVPVEHSHPQDGTPALHLSDGSTRKLAWHTFPDKAISTDFWLFDRTGSPRRLFFPNGDYCDYENDPLTQYQVRVKECRDVFGNKNIFAWTLTPTPPAPPILTITQEVAPSPSRVITVTFPTGLNPGLQYPLELTYDGRTWTYSQTDVYPPGDGSPEDRAQQGRQIERPNLQRQPSGLLATTPITTPQSDGRSERRSSICLQLSTTR